MTLAYSLGRVQLEYSMTGAFWLFCVRDFWGGAVRFGAVGLSVDTAVPMLRIGLRIKENVANGSILVT